MDAYELRLSGSSLAELMKSTLQKGASFRFSARGKSMKPFIRDRDVLTVSKSSETGIRIGDVSAVINPVSGTLIVHRVVGKSDTEVLIKGDNCRFADGLFPCESVAGIVSKVERNGVRVRIGGGTATRCIAFFSRTGMLHRIILPVLRKFRYFIFVRSAYL